MIHASALAFAESEPLFDNPFVPAAAVGAPRLGQFTPAAVGAWPQLTIRAVGGGGGGVFVVSWPVSASEWSLEYSTRWPSGSWVRVSPSSYQTNADQRFVSVSAQEGARYFRLRQSVALAGQTGWWSMDEGTGTVAGEANSVAKTLTLLNAGWASGRIGPGSLHFQGGTGASGSRAWMSNTNYAVLPETGRPFSVSFWFSPELLTSGWQGLAGNAVNGTTGWYVALRTTGPGTNELTFAGQGAPAPLKVTAQTLLLPGQWYQLTASYDGINGSLYLDAALLGQNAGTLPTHDGPIFFGGGVAGYDSFVGRIDEIRARTNHLTLEQVSLRTHWRFDEPDGVSLADSGVEGHDAVLGQWPASTAPVRVDGHEGGGIDLRQGWIEIPNTDFALLPESGGAFSVSCWLRPDGLPVGRSILMRHGVGTSTGWELGIENEASTGLWVHWDARSAGGTLDAKAPVSLADGVWSKLDLTYNGGVATFYLNGRKVYEENGAIQGSSGSLVVGAWPGSTEVPGFSGVIDDLKIYSREREPSEIGPVARVMWETVHRTGMTNLILQGFGPAGRPLTYSIVPRLTPTNGFVTQLAPGSPQVTFQAGNRRGPDAFTYTVSDGEFTTEPTTVVLSVVEPHWLSPAGGGGVVRDGHSPEGAWAAGTADALDAIWRTNNYYDCFYYGPGVYQTRGWRYGQRSTASPGCKHIGSGAEGPVSSTIRLVDIWEPFLEEMIFAPAYLPALVDNFEVHHLILDCNAANLPKFNPGPPEWIRIPLRYPGRVDSVTFRWAGEFVIPGLRAGQAAEFTLTARRLGTDTFVTNYLSAHADGGPDTVPVGSEADELFVQLTRRSPTMDVYGIREIEVAGAEVSLPQVTKAGGGPSQLNATYAMAGALDGDPSTAWASGPEEQVRIEFPLVPGTALTQVNVRWNCRTLLNLERLGPAVSYQLQARNEITGLFQTVPGVRHGRAASGWETNTFGTEDSTNAIVTDRLALLLNARELGVNYYSIREITFQNAGAPVALRMPTALSSMNLGGSFPALKAFDQDTNSWWASKSQGASSAINVAGNNLKLTHLKVIGFGTRAGRECFPIFLTYLGQGGPPNYLGNVLVEDCVISDPAPGNTDGLSAIDMVPAPPDRLTNAVVRRCAVRGLKREFTYSNGIAASVVEHCVVEDCKIGVYFEPEVANLDDFGSILIRSNQFLNVTHGVYLLHHARSYFDSLTVLRNEIVLDGIGGYGVSACDTCAVGPAGTITNLTCLNNIVRYQDWSMPSWLYGGGLMYSDMQHAVLGNNLIVLDSGRALRVRQCPSGFIPPEIPPEDCDHPSTTPPDPPTYPPCLDVLRPGYRRAWFNNRDLSGQLLPVRFANSGLDGLALQQQWPE
jgi:hypothetical protein